MSPLLRVSRMDLAGGSTTDRDAGVRIVDPTSGRAPEIQDLGEGRATVRFGRDPGVPDPPSQPDPRGQPDERGTSEGAVVPPRVHQATVVPIAVRAGEAARFEVVVDGWRFELEVEDAARARLRRRATRATDATSTSGPLDIRAIIPGRIAAVRVAPGDAVEAGQTLLVVEAMKMQNELRSPRAGSVDRVAVGEGQTIDRGDLLVVIR